MWLPAPQDYLLALFCQSRRTWGLAFALSYPLVDFAVGSTAAPAPGRLPACLARSIYFNPRGGKPGIRGKEVAIDHREFPADWFQV